jgi:hypothetical protein
MSVTVDLLTIFHTEFVGIFMIYHHTKFHMPSSDGSLVVITIKLKAKYRLDGAIMLFYILKKSCIGDL